MRCRRGSAGICGRGRAARARSSACRAPGEGKAGNGRKVTTRAGSVPAILDRLAASPHRFADVADRPAAQAARETVVLALLDIARRLVEQLDRRADPVAVAQLRVDRRMVLERLAIVDRRGADLANSGVDLVDRAALVPLDLEVAGR